MTWNTEPCLWSLSLSIDLHQTQSGTQMIYDREVPPGVSNLPSDMHPSLSSRYSRGNHTHLKQHYDWHSPPQTEPQQPQSPADNSACKSLQVNVSVCVLKDVWDIVSFVMSLFIMLLLSSCFWNGHLAIWWICWICSLEDDNERGTHV
jgi:hypothetical protein